MKKVTRNNVKMKLQPNLIKTHQNQTVSLYFHLDGASRSKVGEV